MNAIDLDEQTPAGAPFWVSLLAAPLLPWLVHFAGPGSSYSDTALFSISIFLAVLLHGREGRIPATNLRITPKLVIIFWTVLNLGAVAGIVVAGVAALAGFPADRNRRVAWLKDTATRMLCTIASGAAFAAAFDFFRFAGTVRLPANRLIPNDVLAAGAIMLAVHQLTWLWLNLVSRVIARSGPDYHSSAARPVWRLAGQLLAAAAAVTMFAAFEKTAHEMVEAGEPLTVEAVKNVYGKLLADYFGPDFVIDPQLRLEGLRIPHFYSPFYVYKYATGLSAAIALSERVLAGGREELNDYMSFLKGGCSKWPLELLQDAGVDMTIPVPVETALSYFERLVRELDSTRYNRGGSTPPTCSRVSW